MKPNPLLPAFCLGALFYAAALSAAANAEVYPTKHVSIITQAAAGSGPDVIARLVADRLTQAWGKQVTIIIRQGAAGRIAAQAAAAAQPDGYTLFMPTVSGMIIAPEIQPRFPVKLESDFVPVGQVGSTPMLVAVSPALGVNTLAELITLAKKRPGDAPHAETIAERFPI